MIERGQLLHKQIRYEISEMSAMLFRGTRYIWVFPVAVWLICNKDNECFLFSQNTQQTMRANVSADTNITIPCILIETFSKHSTRLIDHKKKRTPHIHAKTIGNQRWFWFRVLIVKRRTCGRVKGTLPDFANHSNDFTSHPRKQLRISDDDEHTVKESAVNLTPSN